MRIEGCSTGARAGATKPAGPGGTVQREARAGFARHLTARVMLGDEFEIAALEPTVGRQVLDAQVRELEVVVNDWQAPSGRECRQLVAMTRVFRPVRSIEEGLVLAFEFVVQN